MILISFLGGLGAAVTTGADVLGADTLGAALIIGADTFGNETLGAALTTLGADLETETLLGDAGAPELI